MVDRVSAAIELGVAGLIVLASLSYLLPYAGTMATTSLWNDEIVTVAMYSGRGPVHVLTDYGSNSHLLFNLVNSVVPGRLSMAPLRARFFSFAAVFVLLVGALAVFGRRGRILEGALFFGIFAVNGEFLDLALQARGYGLLSLFAGAVCWAAAEWMESGRRRWLLLLVGATVLGAWTIPSFIFFGGSMLALLFLRSPRRDLFLGGCVAAAAAAALYVPVWASFLEEIRLYSSRWGRYYQSFEQVGETVRVYVLPQSLLGGPAPAWLSFAFLTVLVAGPGVLPESRKRDRDAAWLLMSASFLFLTSCLFMTTPPLRTTSFVAVPLVAAGLLLVPPAPGLDSRARAALAALFALVFVPASVRAGRQFTFLPIEDWQTAVRVLDATFPRSVGVHVMASPHLLQPYLRSGRPIEPSQSLELVARGERVWLDDQTTGPERFDGHLLGPDAVAIRVPQRRLGFQAIWFASPTRSHVTGVRWEAGWDHGTEVEVSLEPGIRYRSVVGRFGGDSPPPAVREGGWLTLESGWERLERARCLMADRGVVVPLGDRAIRSVTVRFEPVAGEASPLSHFWAYPSD